MPRSGRVMGLLFMAAVVAEACSGRTSEGVAPTGGPELGGGTPATVVALTATPESAPSWLPGNLRQSLSLELTDPEGKRPKGLIDVGIFTDSVEQGFFDSKVLAGLVRVIDANGGRLPAESVWVLTDKVLPDGDTRSFGLTVADDHTSVISLGNITRATSFPYSHQASLNGEIVGVLCVDMFANGTGTLPGGLPASLENVRSLCRQVSLAATAIFDGQDYDSYAGLVKNGLSLGLLDSGLGPGSREMYALFRAALKGPIMRWKSAH